MTYNNEKIKTNLKVLAISGIAAMMVFALSATSLSQNAYAGNGNPCSNNLGDESWSVFDVETVTDTEAPFDSVIVWKCVSEDIECFADDGDGTPELGGDDDSVGTVVPKKATTRTFCVNTTGAVMKSTDDSAAILADTLPAEWELLDITDHLGNCEVEVKNAGKSATKIRCTTEPVNGDFFAAFTIDLMETRESPGSGKGNQSIDKFKPTGCFLDLNSGAEGFVPGRTFDNDLDVLTAEIPFATDATDSVPIDVESCNG